MTQAFASLRSAHCWLPPYHGLNMQGGGESLDSATMNQGCLKECLGQIYGGIKPWTLGLVDLLLEDFYEVGNVRK